MTAPPPPLSPSEPRPGESGSDTLRLIFLEERAAYLAMLLGKEQERSAKLQAELDALRANHP